MGKRDCRLSLGTSPHGFLLIFSWEYASWPLKLQFYPALLPLLSFLRLRLCSRNSCWNFLSSGHNKASWGYLRTSYSILYLSMVVALGPSSTAIYGHIHEKFHWFSTPCSVVTSDLMRYPSYAYTGPKKLWLNLTMIWSGLGLRNYTILSLTHSDCLGSNGLAACHCLYIPSFFWNTCISEQRDI